MENIFIINGQSPEDGSKGELNRALTALHQKIAFERGCQTRLTELSRGYDIDEEIEKHQWADLIILQFPVHWMSIPWPFKKYMDEVYTAGMDGRLCDGDGRENGSPEAYGTSGLLTGKYMLGATFNAPQSAFENPHAPYFAGISAETLFTPIHMTLKFLGLSALPSFILYDVLNTPENAHSLDALAAHMNKYI